MNQISVNANVRGPRLEFDERFSDDSVWREGTPSGFQDRVEARLRSLYSNHRVKATNH